MTIRRHLEHRRVRTHPPQGPRERGERRRLNPYKGPLSPLLARSLSEIYVSSGQMHHKKANPHAAPRQGVPQYARYRTRIQIGPLYDYKSPSHLHIVHASRSQGLDTLELGQSYLIWTLSMYYSLS